MEVKIILMLALVLVTISTTSAYQVIGSFNSKSFFVDATKTLQTAAGSDTYCKMFGGQLVTPGSSQELTVLQGIIADLDPAQGYWTSALNTNAFRWEGWSGSEVDLISYGASFFTTTCGLIQRGAIITADCDKRYYALCQFTPARKGQIL